MGLLLETFLALLKCYAIILCGVVAGRKLPRGSSEGLYWLINYLLLPALLLSSILKMDFGQINLIFLGSILVGKTLVFVLVVALTLLLGSNLDLGKAGLYAIAATQSNDFAFGRPLLMQIYTDPIYVDYLYFLAPIQLLILNPIAFILLELEKVRHSGQMKFWPIVKSLSTNPVILATLLSFIANLTIKNSFPQSILDFTTEIGKAFNVTALFLLGITLCEYEFCAASLRTPLMLTAGKLILLPLVLSKAVLWMMKNSDMSNFAFIYGIFPSAPSLLIFALLYGMDSGLVSCTLVLTTALSAPVILITTRMMNLTPESSVAGLVSTRFWASLISLVALLLLLLIFTLSRQWRSVTHRVSICLATAQLFLALGGMLALKWCLVGMVSVKIWIAILALVMYLLHHRSFCYVLRGLPYLIGVGLLVPLVVGLVYGFSSSLPDDAMFFSPRSPEAISLCVLDGLCVLLTSLFLVMHWRLRQRLAGPQTCHVQCEEPLGTERDIEDVHTPLLCDPALNCSVQQRKECHQTVAQSSPPDLQLSRHLALLMGLMVNAVLGLFLGLGQLALDPSSGILMELSYFHVGLAYGQGLLTFLCFGTSSRLWHRLWSLPFCHHFSRTHRSTCIDSICFAHNYFRKPDLVTWMAEVGLTEDEQGALQWIKYLTVGEVIAPVNDILYRFL